MSVEVECSIMKSMENNNEKNDKTKINTDIIREAGRILREGGLVAFRQKPYMDWEQTR